jgi:hypothetical protein
VTAGEEPSVSSRDRAAEDLAREIYWLRGDRLPPRAGSDPIGTRLEDFARRRRVDQQELVPNDDSLLASASAWKRILKARIWHVSRFSTKRYDRLLAELAELSSELADRLASTEREVARLREELARGRAEEP